MGEMLSQAEVDALLGGGNGGAPEEESPDDISGGEDNSGLDGILNDEQKDILGEIGNISMGTSATTLFALLGKKVLITTPHVTIRKWGELIESYKRPCVGTRIDYKEGLVGSNILILNQHDVKVISNLMMGGEGEVDDAEPLSELDLSAISEAMNQMIGSASTSLSSLVKKKIDIDTPQTFLLDFNDDSHLSTVNFSMDDVIACISFRMEIDNLVDSNIMQIIPDKFAIDIVDTLMDELTGGSSPSAPHPTLAPAPPRTETAATTPPPPPVQAHEQPAPPPPPQYQEQAYPTPPPQYQEQAYPPPPAYPYGQPAPAYAYPPPPPPVQQNVSPVQFQAFDTASLMQQKENIGLIMDVPLEVTVELGRTNKKIKDILEFVPGTIIELDKLAGDPIDILVNGKFVARGEVVVIDENFGIKITDIINVEDRI